VARAKLGPSTELGGSMHWDFIPAKDGIRPVATFEYVDPACTFALAFSLEHHRHLLELIAGAGTIVLVIGEHPDVGRYLSLGPVYTDMLSAYLSGELP
jgi:hypothetical protein